MIICLACIVIGAAVLISGFFNDPVRAWANFLLAGFYFFLIGIGATFFLTIQYITRSGWSSGFRRIAEALMLYVPVSGVVMLFLYFGIQYLYPWSNPEVIASHEMVAHKSPYMNIPFFMIRMVIFFSVWTWLIYIIRKASIREDKEGGIQFFRKMEVYSRIFIFFLAISFSLLGFDLIMSVEAEWFSTIFALKNFIAAFQHGTIMVFLVIILLNRKGYFTFLNVFHIHDFARYIFMVSIFYGYFWFSQFMLIWYANIPEETIYYAVRWTQEWKTFWILDIVFNWAVPFFILLPVITSQKKWVVATVAIIVMIGLWIDLFVEIFPATVGKSNIGLMEAGTFLGFAGLFALVTSYHLSRASLVPENHPLISESYQHQFESYI